MKREGHQHHQDEPADSGTERNMLSGSSGSCDRDSQTAKQ